ncbi:MAG: efflux RND transporter periplasmic adaptor subunit [Acidobacteriota bacterium]
MTEHERTQQAAGDNPAAEAIEQHEAPEANRTDRRSPTTKRGRRLRHLAILALAAVLALGGVFAVYAAKDAATTDDATAEKAETENGEAPVDAEDAENDPAIPVETVPVERADLAAYISATANLVPENEVQVLAEREGRVARLLVEEGERVAAGQVLAELAKGDAEIALQKAKVRLQNAELNYERTTTLVDEGLVSPQEHDKAVMELGIARQELAEAEWRLEKTQIRAPFDGHLTERAAQVGQDVRVADKLFTVAQFEPLVARIYLAERDVLDLEEGRPVRIVLKADESIEAAGRIRRISPVVDPATGTVKVTAEALRVPPKVRPGAFVRVDVVRERRAGALVVPRDSLVRELQKIYVFVADDGRAAKREVTLGLQEGAVVQALTGVEEGEQVIVAGQGALDDGSPVKVPEPVQVAAR